MARSSKTSSKASPGAPSLSRAPGNRRDAPRDTALAHRASALSRAADGILARLARDGKLSKNAVLNEIASAIAGPGHDWGFLKRRPDGVFVQPGLSPSVFGLPATSLEAARQGGAITAASEPAASILAGAAAGLAAPMAEPADPAPPRARYLAEFTPQAWMGDFAFSVDPEGDTVWDVDDDEIAAVEAEGYARDEIFTPDTYASDQFRHSRRAPAWVRDWSGPFFVTLIDTEEELAGFADTEKETEDGTLDGAEDGRRVVPDRDPDLAPGAVYLVSDGEGLIGDRKFTTLRAATLARDMLLAGGDEFASIGLRDVDGSEEWGLDGSEPDAGVPAADS